MDLPVDRVNEDLLALEAGRGQSRVVVVARSLRRPLARLRAGLSVDHGDARHSIADTIRGRGRAAGVLAADRCR